MTQVARQGVDSGLAAYFTCLACPVWGPLRGAPTTCCAGALRGPPALYAPSAPTEEVLPSQHGLRGMGRAPYPCYGDLLPVFRPIIGAAALLDQPPVIVVPCHLVARGSTHVPTKLVFWTQPDIHI